MSEYTTHILDYLQTRVSQFRTIGDGPSLEGFVLEHGQEYATVAPKQTLGLSVVQAAKRLLLQRPSARHERGADVRGGVHLASGGYCLDAIGAASRGRPYDSSL
jgi:hypothetical protein